MPNYKRDLQSALAERRTCLRIAVCGRFNAGKTSLLNRLLDLLLPVKAVNATGAITKVCYGTDTRVEFQSGQTKIIAPQDLEPYITVRSVTLDGTTPAEAISATVGTQHALLCKGAVEFWDTPGLADDPILTQCTLSALEQCDVALLVMDAAQPLSDLDKRMLHQLPGYVSSNVLPVFTRMDCLSPTESSQIREALGLFLCNCGNEDVGFGPVFVSTKSDHELAERLRLFCTVSSRRQMCLQRARSARTNRLAEAWLADTVASLDEVRSKKTQLKQATDARTTDAERQHRNAVGEISALVQKALYALRDAAQWQAALSPLMQESDWTTRYVSLSQTAMQAHLQSLFSGLTEKVSGTLSLTDYPSCFPPPPLTDDMLWDNMDWGYDFYPTSTESHMLSTGALGAVAGTVIPGVGTILGGLFGLATGFVRDMADDSDLQSRRAHFESTCAGRTVEAFQKGPGELAEARILHFRDELLSRMEHDFSQRQAAIAHDLAFLCQREEWLTCEQQAAERYVHAS